MAKEPIAGNKDRQDGYPTMASEVGVSLEDSASGPFQERRLIISHDPGKDQHQVLTGFVYLEEGDVFRGTAAVLPEVRFVKDVIKGGRGEANTWHYLK